MTGFAEGFALTPTIRLRKKLGHGGMGTVWLADHLTLQCRVVVKFISSILASDTESVARFSREAAAAAQVRSPHVVQIFDHGVASGGVPFIVMELLEGRDLARHLEDLVRISPRATAIIVAQVAKALQRAHELGIVHRDIKPENVFLCDLGTEEVFVKLLDFGIAKRKDPRTTASTLAGAQMGTPQYMSPERLTGSKPVDPKDDLWALAVMAFEAMTGERPFRGATPIAIGLAVHGAKRPKPSALVAAIPAAVDDWCQRCFELDPTKRFATARAMAEALTGAAGERDSATAEQVATAGAPRGSGTPSSKRRVHGAVALGVLALSGVVITAMTRGRASPEVMVPSAVVSETASTPTTVATRSASAAQDEKTTSLSAQAPPLVAPKTIAKSVVSPKGASAAGSVAPPQPPQPPAPTGVLKTIKDYDDVN